MIERATRAWLLRADQQTTGQPADHVTALIDAALPVVQQTIRDEYQRGYHHGQRDCP